MDNNQMVVLEKPADKPCKEMGDTFDSDSRAHRYYFSEDRSIYAVLC